MGQEGILRVLRENKDKWYTSRELAKILEIEFSAATNNLSKLRDTGFLKWENNGVSNAYRYKHKE